MDEEPLYRTLEGNLPVRFIRLLPGTADDTVKVELVHDHLRPFQNYEATSYTWGSPDDLDDVLCSGRRRRLRKNAVDFLRRLRQPGESRLLWMDCICINQDDLDERSRQVEIMNDIYRNANSVLIWLGDEGEDSDLIMSFASTLDGKKYGQEAINTWLWWLDNSGLSAKSSLFDLITPEAEGRRIARAAAALAQRSWLCRIWVQQEAGVCWDTRVICGRRDISWNQFFSVLWLLKRRSSGEWPDWLENDERATEAGIQAVMEIQRARLYHIRYPRLFTVRLWFPGYVSGSWSGSGRFDPYADTTQFTSTFAAMLTNLSFCKASDPRDKVFAVYSIYGTYRSRIRNRPPVDYRLSWQELYTKVAKWLSEDRSFGFQSENGYLDLAGRCQQRGQDIPSWVPDLRYSLEPFFINHGEWTAASAYRPQLRFLTLPRPKAGEPKLPQYIFTDQSGRRKKLASMAVQLPCFLLDRVCYRSALPLSRHEFIHHNLEGVKAMVTESLDYARMHVPRYMTGETADEAFAGTIISSTTHLGRLASREYESGFADFNSWLDAGAADPAPEYAYAVSQSAVLSNFPFCVTAHGLMCLVPQVCEKGDYVGILAGFRWPVAMRKVGEPSRQQYELLGPCYVHRMMRGRCLGLVDEFRSKYRPGSEDESMRCDEQFIDDLHGRLPDESPCGFFPFNEKQDYARVRRVLGKRPIMLV